VRTEDGDEVAEQHLQLGGHELEVDDVDQGPH
jgi:hypothetical protein